MDHIRKLEWVTNKKHRGVVANEVIVSFVRVELDRKTTRITFDIGRALFSADCREPHENFGFPTNFTEQTGLRVSGHVCTCLKITERAGTFRVNHAFGYAFAVEMSEF